MSNQKIKYSAINLVLALTIGGQVEAKKDIVKSLKIENDNVAAEGIQPLESWMFEELNPTPELKSLEDWMFNELQAAEEGVSFESWMFDTEYFSKK